MDCAICFQTSPLLYSISNCNHRFCLNCCMSHINQKSSLFVDIVCPQVNCNKPFNKNPQIMNRLLPKVLQNIRKRQKFNYLAQNPHIKSCSAPSCQGEINLKQNKKVCNRCLTPHCPKCIKPFHIGPCILNQHQSQMRSLNYQKCPQCSIWVQKKQGCNYIDCKCGTNFCYSCGVAFKDDPCRLTQKWSLQNQIRVNLKNLKFGFHSKQKLEEPSKSQKLMHFVKLPIKLLLILLYTIFLSLASNIVIIVIIALIIIFSPVIVIIAACSFQKCLYRALVLIFMPLLAALVILLTFLIFGLYPFLRRSNHHGIYDGFDMVVAHAANIYLKGFNKILRP